MYLIHVRLGPPVDDLPLPSGLAQLLQAMSTPEDRVEHVAVHPDALPWPTLGVYLVADCLRDAEERAARLCGRGVTGIPLLRGWRLVNAQAPLVVPFYEQLLSSSGLGGLNGPGPFPST